MKKVLVALFVVLILILFTVPALADGDILGGVPIGFGTTSMWEGNSQGNDWGLYPLYQVGVCMVISPDDCRPRNILFWPGAHFAASFNSPPKYWETEVNLYLGKNCDNPGHFFGFGGQVYSRDMDEGSWDLGLALPLGYNFSFLDDDALFPFRLQAYVAPETVLPDSHGDQMKFGFKAGVKFIFDRFVGFELGRWRSRPRN